MKMCDSLRDNPVVIASEAKQSRMFMQTLDCHVAIQAPRND